MIFQTVGISSPLFLKLRVVALAGPDAHRAADIEYEELAVADRAGGRRGLDRLDDAIRDIGGADELDLDLGHHVGGVFGAAIDFGLALLAAEPLARKSVV